MDQKFIASASIDINASPDKVWEALTNPVLVKKYFFGIDLITDWQVGGTIIYRGEWNGQQFEDRGTVLEVVPNQTLVSSYWSAAFGTEDTPENHQKVTYSLTSRDPATTHLEITQAGSPSQDSADHSSQNWAMVLQEMKKLLENPQPEIH